MADAKEPIGEAKPMGYSVWGNISDRQYDRGIRKHVIENTL